MKIIAHRGLRSELPENTTDAILAAVEVNGVHGVEFDVEISLDGRAVVLHQETVVPNHDFSAIIPASRDYSSRDWVSQHVSSSITQLDAGGWFGSGFSRVRVPTLGEVMALQWNEKIPYVELKDATYWGRRDPERPRQMVDAALPDLLACKRRPEVISFNPHILNELNVRSPHIPRILALWTDRQNDFEAVFHDCIFCHATTILFADLMVLSDPDWVKRSRDAGLSVYVYPVSPAWDEPEHAEWTASSQLMKWDRLEEFGIDGLISDFARESVAHFNSIRPAHSK